MRVVERSVREARVGGRNRQEDRVFVIRKEEQRIIERIFSICLERGWRLCLCLLVG